MLTCYSVWGTPGHGSLLRGRAVGHARHGRRVSLAESTYACVFPSQLSDQSLNDNDFDIEPGIKSFPLSFRIYVLS